MKKLFFPIVVFLLLIALASATNKNVTEKNECKEINDSCCRGEICSITFVDCVEGEDAVFKGCDKECIPKWECKPIKQTKIIPGENVSECPESCKCQGSVVSCPTETGKIMTITAGKSGNVITITMEKTNVSTTVEIIREKNKTYANTSEGKKEIKIMPDTASEKAIEVLKAKNLTIILKDTGKGHLVYEANTTKTLKILGFIKKKIKLQTQIDAETGDIVVKTKKPWWAFLASEKEE